MTPMIDLVNKLTERVSMPEKILRGNSFSQVMWMLGKQKAIKELRRAVKQNNSKPLPYLDEPPKNLFKSFSEDEVKTWFKAYNYTIHVFQEESMKMIVRSIINSP